MKKTLLAASLFILLGSAHAFADTVHYSFAYDSTVWGNMWIVEVDSDTLAVVYLASGSIPSGTQATGFAFAPDLGAFSVSNPGDADNVWDQDSLNWVKYTGDPTTLPTPTNGTDPVDGWAFAATDPQHGGDGVFTPPGILPGAADVFFLDFDTDVAVSEITAVGVRLQSLPVDVNGGSLFLVGTPGTTPNPYDTPVVPEPTTMLLFGTGLVGLAGVARRKRS